MAERSKVNSSRVLFIQFGQLNPPEKLETDKWSQAYDFYDSLNGGRTVLEFEHSLKNSRDDFDVF